MEVEKKRSKGGFLNLFDWNGKSRKKLFVDNSELPGSKHGKEHADNLSRLYKTEVVEEGASSINKVSNEWNCGLSVTSDEGSGTRAPGVVARLMGLDSLPSANVPEPYSPEASVYDRNNNDIWTDNRTMEKISWNLLEYRTYKGQNKAIERFQTEMLPPKSAKSIPITHHKLLSPIKSSPGFTAARNAAYIMEAAAKIIEANPRSSMKSKLSPVGPSSVPLRIRDLKEKAEAAHKKTSRPEKPKEASVGNFTKRGSSDKNHNGSDRNKGKSVSLAVQAKANIQSRDSSTSCSNRTSSSINQKEQNVVKANQVFKSQPNAQNTTQKRGSLYRNNNVLRQNNQKQNSISNKERLMSKTPVSNQPDGRTQSISCSTGPNKSSSTVNIGSKTESSSIHPTDAEREFSISRRKNVSRKKRSVSQDVSLGVTFVNDASVHKGETHVKCNITSEGSINWDADRSKQGMDIVSFTFTSPLKKSTVESHSSIKNSSSASPGVNFICGDALSVLLEQKLQELTCKVESSRRNVSKGITFISSPSHTQDSFSNRVTPTLREDGERFQLDLNYKVDSPYRYECVSADAPVQVVDRQWEGIEEVEDHSSSETITVLTFERSFGSGSCSEDRSTARSTKKDSFVQAEDIINFPMCGETELSISASSAGDNSRKQQTRTFSLTDCNDKSNWELEYVRNILGNTDLALEDYALGVTPRLIDPSNLFNNLENQGNSMDSSNPPENSKLECKVLFDSVNECLESKCKQILVGSCRTWGRWNTVFRRKGRLAEELYEEIEGWKWMREMMVDEVVDRDMSSGLGKWVNFENEEFEESIEIEKVILTSLIDEVITDFLIIT